MNDILIEKSVSDAIVEKPIEFSISFQEEVLEDKEIEKEEQFLKFFKRKIKFIEKVREEKTVKRDFKVYTPSIGKLQILSGLFLKLEIDFDFFQQDPSTALFQCCHKKTDVLAEIMAVSVFKTKQDLLNTTLIKSTADFFKWHCTPSDFSIIVGAILTQIDLSNFSNSIRLTKLFRLNVPRNKNGADRVEKSAAAPSGEVS